ncbi:MAG: alanine racemase, partial [Anaerovoracaceae bacterium]
MERFNDYPRLTIDLKKLRHNIDEVKTRCEAVGINLAGVIKVVHGIPECSKQFEDAGCAQIASSRLEQLKVAKDFGIKTPLMMIRIPMLSEIEAMIEI